MASYSRLPIPALNTPGQPFGWRASDPSLVTLIHAKGQPAYLEVAVPANSENTTADAELALPAYDIAEDLVQVTVEARVKDVTKPTESYNGVKVMLHVTSTLQADTWDQADANGDTFPVTYSWKKLSFRSPIPMSAKTATLVLGLQGSTGTVDFRNISIKLFRKAMPGYPSNVNVAVYKGHSADALRGVMISPDISPADIETLKKWNVNLVCWQLTWGGFPRSKTDIASPAAYDAWLTGSLKHLDDMLPYLKKANILVVLDLHTPPGGSDPGGVDRVFSDAIWQKHFVDCWRMMATKYRGEKQIWGYDLFNEPVAGVELDNLLDWHDLADKQRIWFVGLIRITPSSLSPIRVVVQTHFGTFSHLTSQGSYTAFICMHRTNLRIRVYMWATLWGRFILEKLQGCIGTKGKCDSIYSPLPTTLRHSTCRSILANSARSDGQPVLTSIWQMLLTSLKATVGTGLTTRSANGKAGAWK
jgi:hypothetical protein